MNPLYQQITGGQQPAMQQANGPMQRFGDMMRAMRDPASFIRSRFPDIPNNIANDPVQILAYLQRTRGITNQQLEQLLNMYGGR